MHEFHPLLRRQLRRLCAEGPPPEAWHPLLQAVHHAYVQADRDRGLLERAMEISSQELLQTNADIRAVLEGLIQYYLRLDETGRILYARGQALPPLFDARRFGTGQLLVEVVDPANREEVAAAYQTLSATSAMQIIEVSLTEPYGAHWYEIRLIPAHQRQTSVIVRDVTETHLARQRERALNDKLAQAERIETLGILAGSVAHDLNNILAPLTAYPDLLLAHPALADRPEIRDMIASMQHAAIHAGAIIKNMLTLTRRGLRQADKIDLNQLIRSLLDSPALIDLLRRHPSVRLTHELASSLPTIRGSPQQVEQAVLNLIINACEACEKGGDVMVRTERREEPPHPTGVLLVVSDSGIGISREHLDKIYEPFYTSKPPGASGTGLGLSIVYGTVKDCEGTIQVRSEPGQGTCFTLWFPAFVHGDAPGSEGSGPETGQAPQAPRPTVRILVVDDDATQRTLCRTLLTACGYQVETAINGREGIQRLREEAFDLVLLDMIMEPDFDGLRTYETLHVFKPQQPCLIVSGYAETDNVRRALDLGVRGFVQKPYTLDVMLAAIRSALDHAQP
jgi:signal transduction histidine kinase/CheY-like chemotaxis protein